MILGADGGVRYASPSVAQALGYPPEELIGTSVLALVDPATEAGARAAFAAGNGNLRRRTQELRLRHRDGSWREVEAVTSDLTAEPSVGGVVVNFWDVTERRRAEEALRQSEEQLQQAQKMEAI